MMSSTVDSSGMLMVLEMAPEMKGCTAAIIFTWPMWWMKRVAVLRPQAAVEHRQVLVLQCGAPSMVPVASMWLTICSTCSGV